MQFLKTLFWVALAVVLVLFAHSNWHPVTLELWGGLEADVKLPVLVFGVFLLGFVPTMIFYRAQLWSLRRRLDTHERNAAYTTNAADAALDPSERAVVEGADQRLSGQSTVSPAP